MDKIDSVMGMVMEILRIRKMVFHNKLNLDNPWSKLLRNTVLFFRNEMLKTMNEEKENDECMCDENNVFCDPDQYTKDGTGEVDDFVEVVDMEFLENTTSSNTKKKENKENDDEIDDLYEADGSSDSTDCDGCLTEYGSDGDEEYRTKLTQMLALSLIELNRIRQDKEFKITKVYNE